jgi:hypothetical protein
MKALVLSVVSFCLVAAPTRVGAQQIDVRAVAAEDQHPMTGAIVGLEDAAGRMAKPALVDEQGRARITLDSAGRYRVLVQRVGYERWRSAPLGVGANDTLRVTAALVPRRTTLAAVTVTGKRSCSSAPTGITRLAAVWEEARTALRSADLAARSRTGELQVRHVTRDLDPDLQVVRESTSATIVRTNRPFQARPASELTARGYVWPAVDGSIYNGPDAAVLLSEDFVATHCFSLVEGDRGAHAGQLGVAFQPSPGRTLPDIAGTIWVDADSSYLRAVDYVYTNTPDAAEAPHAGGHVEFAPLDDGVWVVRRWFIRTPRLALAAPRRVGTIRSTDWTSRLLGYHEEGGVATRPEAGAAAESRVALLSGTVFDSTTQRPLAGARVAVSDTYTATTDDGGTFRIAVPLPRDDSSRHAVRVEAPRLELLGLPALEAVVRLDPAVEQRIALAVPGVDSLRARYCRAPRGGTAEAHLGGGPGMLVGRVADSADAQAADHATISLTWSRAVLDQTSAGTIAGTRSSAYTVETRADGWFVACDLPVETPIAVSVAAAGRRASATGGTAPARATVRIPTSGLATIRLLAGGDGASRER